MSIVATLQSGLHMLYLGQRRSYFSKVNKGLAKLIFLHFERDAFVCYFMLHLITIFSLYSCIILRAKLKGTQNAPMPGVMQFQRQVPAPCSTFFRDWGFSCCHPGSDLNVYHHFREVFELRAQSVCPLVALCLHSPSSERIQLGLSCFPGMLGVKETNTATL